MPFASAACRRAARSLRRSRARGPICPACGNVYADAARFPQREAGGVFCRGVSACRSASLRHPASFCLVLPARAVPRCRPASLRRPLSPLPVARPLDLFHRCSVSLRFLGSFCKIAELRRKIGSPLLHVFLYGLVARHRAPSLSLAIVRRRMFSGRRRRRGLQSRRRRLLLWGRAPSRLFLNVWWAPPPMDWLTPSLPARMPRKPGQGGANAQDRADC